MEERYYRRQKVLEKSCKEGEKEKGKQKNKNKKPTIRITKSGSVVRGSSEWEVVGGGGRKRRDGCCCMVQTDGNVKRSERNEAKTQVLEYSSNIQC